MRTVLLIIATPLMIFSLSVGYYFKSSNLILEISGGDSSYTVKVASETYNSTGTLSIPWEKGKVESITIIGDQTKEKKKVVIEGLHDSPPNVSIDIPSVVGLREAKVKINVWDDWDKPGDLDVRCTVDGTVSSCQEIETIYLEGENHTFEVVAKDSFGNSTVVYKNFKFDQSVPKIPRMNLNSPGMVTFPESPMLRFIMPSIGIQKKVSALKLDKGYILQPVNEAGNRGQVFVIPPIPSNLTPLPGKAITSIPRSFILLGPGSYSVVGKVLIPQGKVIAMSENSQLNIPLNSTLIVKGQLLNISGKPSIVGEGNISLQENGELYLKNVNVLPKISANGGKVMSLQHVSLNGGLSLDGTRFLVLKDVKLDKISCKDCYGVYLTNVSAKDIALDNISEIVMDSVEASNVSISDFTRTTLKNSTISSISIDTLTRLDAFNSKIGDLSVDKGSFARMRNCGIEKMYLNWFSKVICHMCNLKSVEKYNSEVIER